MNATSPASNHLHPATTDSAPRPQVITGGILLLAFGLRLFQLGSQSLWEDEIFTATQAVLPIKELLAWTAGDIHPPGYYVILGLLAHIGGWATQTPGMPTDWLWRLPSAIFGVLAVAASYRLGCSLMGRKTATVTALLLAICPVAIQYSQEARMHELFLLAALLSTWVLARALAHPARWWLWIAYGAATALSLYTVYLGFAVLAAQAVWVLLTALRRRPVRLLVSWGLGCAVACLLYVPWWPVLIAIVGQKLAPSPGTATAALGAPLQFGLNFLRSLGPADNWTVWLYFGLWIIGVTSLIKFHPALAAFGAAWMLVPAVVAYGLNDPRALHMRNAFLLPVYLLFVARGITWIAEGFRRAEKQRMLPGVRLLALGVVIVAVTVTHLPTTYAIPKTDWRGAARYMEDRTRAGDVIVTGALFDMRRYLDYYYDGPAELVTPALLVYTLPHRVKSMRASGGSVWAVTRFPPDPTAASQPVTFTGLVVSAPTMPIYEPDVLAGAMIGLMQQEVAAAFDWAAEMQRQGLMEPDPMVARAAAYLFLGDVYRAAGDLPEAIGAYEAMVADEPPSAGGYVTLADAYLAGGQMEAAARAYSRAVALNRDWQGEATRQANALLEAGEWAQAVAAFEGIIKSPSELTD